MAKIFESILKWRYWMFAILIFFLGICISMHVSSCVISNEGTVLTFVGILATFVVVSNYYQVVEIERKMNEKIENLESKILDINTLKEDITNTLSKNNQSVIFELVKLIRKYENANKKKKEKIINQLYSFNEIESDIVRDKVFEIIGRIINTKIRSKITHAFTEQILSLIATFLSSKLNDKSFLALSEISLNYALDLTYNTFIKTKKIAPAENSIKIVSHINNLSSTRNIPELTNKINWFFDYMETQLNRTDVGDQVDALKLLKVFKDDLPNFDNSFPFYKDHALRDRMEKEINEEK